MKSQKPRCLRTMMFLASATLAHAEPDSNIKIYAAENNPGYWTAERYAQATPQELPSITKTVQCNAASQIPAKTDKQVGKDGKPPLLDVAPQTNNFIFKPDSLGSAHSITAKYGNVGTEKAQFSSSRLIPLEADLVYPYRAAGKIFMTLHDGSPSACSGAVIAPRLVLTAGHCVNDGEPGLNFTNITFVPSFRSGSAPFGTWEASTFFVTKAWETGGGKVPNVADYAIIEVKDNAQGQRLGDVVGMLGYQVDSLHDNHVLELGYPANLDSGKIMHQVYTASYCLDDENTMVVGSDMMGGSSGGPWIQNFGEAAEGQPGGLNSGMNRVVGVTSFGPKEEHSAAKYQGSSTLNETFLELLDIACKHKLGNCDE